jgi:hypothetical protein
VHVLKGVRLLQSVQEQPNAAAAAAQRTPHLNEPRRHLREIGCAAALARVEEVSVGRAHLRKLKRNSVVNVDITAIICVEAIDIANSVVVIKVLSARVFTSVPAATARHGCHLHKRQERPNSSPRNRHVVHLAARDKQLTPMSRVHCGMEVDAGGGHVHGLGQQVAGIEVELEELAALVPEHNVTKTHCVMELAWYNGNEPP